MGVHNLTSGVFAEEEEVLKRAREEELWQQGAAALAGVAEGQIFRRG